MSNKKELEDMVIDAKSKTENNVFSLLEIATTFLSFVNLPLGISLTVLTLAVDSVNKNRNLNKTYMSDDWLKKVSKSHTVSKKGLLYLSECLNKNGNEKISVKDALRFIDIEKSINKQSFLELSNDKEKNAGAKAILKKVENEKQEVLIDERKVKRKELIKNVIEVAPKIITIAITLATKRKKK